MLETGISASVQNMDVNLSGNSLLKKKKKNHIKKDIRKPNLQNPF